MKRILSLITTASLVWGMTHTGVSAGNKPGHKPLASTPRSTLPLRSIPYTEDTITQLQALAEAALKEYSPGSGSPITATMAHSTPLELRGTTYNLHRMGEAYYNFLYIPEALPLCKPTITSFIPASVFKASQFQIRTNFYTEASNACELGCRFGSATNSIECRLDGICGKILQKINSNANYATLPKDERKKFMALCRIFNKWQLFKLLSVEYNKLKDEGKNVENYGFLVIEVTNSETSPQTPSPDDSIVGESTFYVKTIAQRQT